MPLFVDASGQRFWEIRREGATIVWRTGAMGREGRTRTRRFESALLARWHYRDMVEQKRQSEGYRLEDPEPELEPKRGALSPLEQRLREHSEDAEAAAVYADWLQSRGDARGELIALQLAERGATYPAERARLGAAIEELLRARGGELLGELDGVSGAVELAWELGQVRRAKVGYEQGEVKLDRWMEIVRAALPEVPARGLLGTLLEALFELPAVGGLRELAIGTAGTTDYQDTMAVIVEAAPPALQRLEIWADGRRLSSDAKLAPLRFLGLEHFSCDLNLSVAALRQVATAEWPALGSLAVTFSGSHGAWGSDLEETSAAWPAAIEEIAPLLAGRGVPRLRQLEMTTPVPNELCRALLDAPVVEQLERLVIRTRRPVDPEAVQALRKRAPFAIVTG